MWFPPPQKRVVREESKLLSMMPLTGTSKANRTLLYSIQQEVSRYFLILHNPDNACLCLQSAVEIKVKRLSRVFFFVCHTVKQCFNLSVYISLYLMSALLQHSLKTDNL